MPGIEFHDEIVINPLRNAIFQFIVVPADDLAPVPVDLCTACFELQHLMCTC